MLIMSIYRLFLKYFLKFYNDVFFLFSSTITINKIIINYSNDLISYSNE